MSRFEAWMAALANRDAAFRQLALLALAWLLTWLLIRGHPRLAGATLAAGLVVFYGSLIVMAMR